MADMDHEPEVISPAAVTKVMDKVDRDAMGDIKAVAPKPSASKKKATGTKPRKSVSDEHPKYSVMIADAISQLKERGGSSRQAILGYIISHYRVGTEVNKINARVKMALKAGVKSELLNQTKGTGASGSFRLGQRQKTSQKTARPRLSTAKATGSGKTAAKKSAVRKPKSPAKKTAPKKAKSPAKMAKRTKAAPKKMKTAASKAKSAAAKKSIKQNKSVKTAGKK